MVKKNRTWLALFMALCFVIGTVPARALDRDDHRCEARIHKAEANLEKAIHKHGEHSRQAEKRRHDLEEARERCHRDHDHDHDHDGHR